MKTGRDSLGAISFRKQNILQFIDILVTTENTGCKFNVTKTPRNYTPSHSTIIYRQADKQKQ